MIVKCKQCDYENPAGESHCLVCNADLSVYGVKVASSGKTFYSIVTTPQAAHVAPKPTPAALPAKQPTPAVKAKLATRPRLVTSTNRQYVLLPQAPTTIGCRGASILLSGSDVQPLHAQIEASGSGFQIKAVQGGVRVNSHTLTAPRALLNGDLIEIGTHQLTYQGMSSGVIQPASTLPPAIVPPVVPLPVTPPIRQPTPAPLAASYPAKWGPPQLAGHIMHIDGPHLESPTLTMVLISIVWRLITVGLIRYTPPSIPARYLRIKNTTGQENIVKMKGEILTGHLSYGDDASFWGRWYGQSLHMVRAYNHITQDPVQLQQIDSIGARVSRGLLLGIGLFIVAIILLVLLNSL